MKTMVQFLKSLYQKFVNFLLLCVLAALEKLSPTRPGDATKSFSMQKKRKPQMDMNLVQTMTYNNWREIPQQYRKALAQMHHKAIDGLMRDLIQMDDDDIDIIKVYLIEDKPIAWYSVACHHSRFDRETCFWVKTKFRGRGLGKAMWDDFFKWLHKHGNEFLNYNLYDDSVGYYKTVRDRLSPKVRNCISY